MSGKVTPFLWFDDRAEEAARFYVSLFADAKITHVSPLTVGFELEGLPFTALNGGPTYAFTPAVSFSIDCASQSEIDHFWNAFADGGEPMRCGWVRDRFGLTWQVVPSVLPALLGDDDEAKSEAVMTAMLAMVKLDIAGLQAAYDGA